MQLRLNKYIIAKKIKELVAKYYPEKQTESALYKAKRAVFKKGAEEFSRLQEVKEKPVNSSDKEPLFVYFVSYNFLDQNMIRAGRIEIGFKRKIKNIFDVIELEKEIEVNHIKQKCIVINFIQL
jgi:hypothetical protein